MKVLNYRFLPVPSTNGFFPGDFSLTDIFVYSLLLNSCQDPRDLIHVKTAKLAELSRVDVRSVRRSIAKLIDRGYITYKDDTNDGRRRAYRIVKFPPKRKRGQEQVSAPYSKKGPTKNDTKRG